MGPSAATKDMDAQLATMLQGQVQGPNGVVNCWRLHKKLAEVAAATSVADPRTAVDALLGILKEANSGSDAQAFITNFEKSMRSNPHQLKGLLLLAAGHLNMIPLCDSNPVYMVDQDSNFCVTNVNQIISSSAELSDPNAPNPPYTVVSIVGVQSSGKLRITQFQFTRPIILVVLINF